MNWLADFMSADLWVVPTNGGIENGLLVVDNPVMNGILGMFPADLHQQISDVLDSKGVEVALIVSPSWPKGRMGIIRVNTRTDIMIGCTALLWWMLEHTEAKVHVALPKIPRWMLGFENLTVYDYEGNVCRD